MVERARLTPRFVFEAECPTQGERWIADTKIKGFGLRLWSTKSGGQKAFALRISDQTSRKIRRTFDPSKTWRDAFPGEDDKYGLGDFLDEAREWARDEIDRLKGHSTIGDEEKRRHRETTKLVRSLPLGRAANAILIGLKTNGSSQRYIDRLDKLFSNHVPTKLKQTPLINLKPRQVARAIVKAAAPLETSESFDHSFRKSLNAEHHSTDRLGVFTMSSPRNSPLNGIASATSGFRS